MTRVQTIPAMGGLNMNLDIKVDTEITVDWKRIQPVRLGSDFSPAEPPDAYVMVSKAGIPSQRFDVFYSDTAANFCIKAVHWKQWIAIGCCNLVYLVSLSSDKKIPTPISDDCDFGDYFSDFWSGPDFMLIVGGFSSAETVNWPIRAISSSRASGSKADTSVRAEPVSALLRIMK